MTDSPWDLQVQPEPKGVALFVGRNWIILGVILLALAVIG